MIRRVALVLLSALLLPASHAWAQDRLFTNDGSSDFSGFGFVMAGLGDLDLDGVPDYIVGSLACTSPHGKLARVFSGATGTLIREHVGDPSGCYGMSVANLGDLDGDGVGDYGVGDVRVDSLIAPQAGRVFLYSGVDGSVIRIHEGDSSADRYGMSLSSAGDVDGDGVPDVMIGSGWDSTTGVEVGSADVYSGATGALLHHFDGDSPHDWFGASCAAVNDLDGDGVGDLAIGAPIRWYDATGTEPAGYVRLYSGRTGAPLATWHGVPPEDHYGISLAGLGDLDGDGAGDVVVGAPRRRVIIHGVPAEVGRVEVRSGATGLLLFGANGTSKSKYGTSVRNLGDFDGDGIDDALIGACYCQNNIPLNAGNGWVEIRSGATGAILAKLVDGKNLQSFAYAVAGLGDLTGDGIPDFGVGNTFDDAHGYQTGSAWVYSGADLSLTMDSQQVSLSLGGTQQLQLDAGPEHASALYILLGSVSGTSPGFNVGGQHVALNFDAFTSLLLANPTLSLYGSTLGTLDGQGQAQIAIAFPAGVVPASAVGLVMHHACVLHGPGGVSFVSNSLPLTLQP